MTRVKQIVLTLITFSRVRHEVKMFLQLLFTDSKPPKMYVWDSQHLLDNARCPHISAA